MNLVTTHDWSTPVDVEHLRAVRADLGTFAVGGVQHLVLEVIAYALDEAAEGSTTRIDVEARADGSLCISDDGRGTDTRIDGRGVARVKPIMATADLRFRDADAQLVLADGLPRRGMSFVAVSCAWVEHATVRADGGWVARYERGFPVGSPRAASLAGQGTGTVVHLRPDPDVYGSEPLDLAQFRAVMATVETTAALTIRGDG